MEFTDKQAIYLQIVDYVCDCIVAEKWQTDQKIPSVRDLAVELFVNPNTVMRAYEHLQSKGILYTKRGIGLHVTADALSTIVNARRERFLIAEIPEFFSKLTQLTISFEELHQQYLHYLESHKDNSL